MRSDSRLSKTGLNPQICLVECMLAAACRFNPARRAGERPLGDRLEATDAALIRYRDAVIAEARRARAAPFTERDKQTLAEATGALVALSGIAEGF